MHILCDTVLWGCRCVVDVIWEYIILPAFLHCSMFSWKQLTPVLACCAPGLLHGDARQFTCYTCWRVLPPHRTDMCNRNPKLGWMGVHGGVCVHVKVPQNSHEQGLKSSICSLLQSNIRDFIHMTKEQEEKEQTYLKIRLKEDWKQLEAIKQPDKKNLATVIQEFCHRLMRGETK